MNKSIKNGFCPRCGALIRDNMCQSCDFTINVNEYKQMRSQVMDEDDFGAIPEPEKKKKTGLIIAVIIGIILFVLLISVILAIGAYFVLNHNNATMKTDIKYLEEDIYENVYEDFESSYEYIYEEDIEQDLETEDYFEEYGNTIKEPDAPEGTWDDIWDTIEE